MSAFIHIRSQKFPPLPGEEEETVNEGMYGKALCQYLQKAFQKQGYQELVYFCEDWGWLLEVKDFPISVGICVYSDAEQGESVTDYVLTDSSLGKMKKWSWKKFSYVDYSDSWAKFNQDLLKILESDPDVDIIGVLKEFPF